MVEQIAKIEKVFLGREDHGIFTCVVHFDYGGSGQAGGMYALDEPIGDGARVGTDFGMEWVIRLIAAAGVDEFSEVVGRTVLVLRDSDDWNAPVVGIRPLPTERGKEFIFSELSDTFFANG